MRSRSGIAIAYAGAALIGVAGILLSVLVFAQTARTFGSQSSRPPASVSGTPRTLPSTGPPTPASRAGLPGAAGPAGGGAPGGGQASRSYPPGEPPGDIEDDSSPAPSRGGPVAGVTLPLPSHTPALPVGSPPPIP